MKIYCVFRRMFEDEQHLWKVFDTKIKAENWIKEYGQWANFEIEEWEVR